MAERSADDRKCRVEFKCNQHLSETYFRRATIDKNFPILCEDCDQPATEVRWIETTQD